LAKRNVLSLPVFGPPGYHSVLRHVRQW